MGVLDWSVLGWTYPASEYSLDRGQCDGEGEVG